MSDGCCPLPQPSALPCLSGPADVEVDATMVLGRTGEAYFVAEVEEDLPAGLHGAPRRRYSTS